MIGKEILAVEMKDEVTGAKDSIGDYIRDMIDEELCYNGTYDKIIKKRRLSTEQEITDYSFYDDPIWKKNWNKMVKEIANTLKL